MFKVTPPRDFLIDASWFATLFNAGTSMVRSCSLLAKEGRYSETRRVFKELVKLLDDGNTMTRSLSKINSKFWSAPITIALIRAGEVGGVLDETADRLARLVEFQREYRFQRSPEIQRIFLLNAWSCLLYSGVPILQSVSILADSANDAELSAILLGLRDSIREGERICDYQPFTDYVGDRIATLISLGEETGALDAFLEKCAEMLLYEIEAP